MVKKSAEWNLLHDQVARGFARKSGRAWLYHVPVCWITLWMYRCATLAKVAGVRQAPVNRDAWQKLGGQ